MKLSFKEFGSTIISIAIFQIATFIISLISLIGLYNLNNIYGVEIISTSQFITDLLIYIFIIISIIIIMFKNKIGIYIYVITIITSLIVSFIFTGLNIEDILLSLVIPVLFLFLIYRKKYLF